jgi:hypothetical protein
VATYRHPTGDYLRAALAAGLQVVRCEEPQSRWATTDARAATEPPPDLDPGPWDGWPWTLMPLIPDATRAAWAAPSVVIWHFQRPTG